MSRHALLLCAAAIALVSSVPLEAAAAWRQVRAPHFLLIGDVSERQLRETARRLERFSDAVGRLMPGTVTVPPVPTVVILFGSERAFAPYQATRDGHRLTTVTGYFQPGDLVNYIAMNVANRGDAFRVVFHEYMHSIVRNNVGPVPDWLGEGLAQLFETMELEDGSALVGAARAEHLQMLLDGPLLPLEQLFTAEALSTGTSVRRQSMFYAQSWALLHYLLLGDDIRAAQLRGYLDRLQRGEAFATAFGLAFGANGGELEAELRGYVTQLRFRARHVAFEQELASVDIPRSEPLADADANAYLGDLLARTGRTEAARRQLQPLVGAGDGNARARAFLGWLELREGNVDLALTLLERAASARPDDASIQGAYGAALYEQARRYQSNRAELHATLARAADVLERAVQLNPASAPALAALAQVELGLARDPAGAEALIARAVAAAPARLEYKLGWAEALIAAGRPERAAELLRSLEARDDFEIREAARSSLARMRDAAAIGSGPPVPRPALRVLQPGETRVSGRLRRMECTSSFALYHVETGDARTLRLVETVGGVQLVSYGTSGRRTITCGEIPGAPHVLATYRAIADALDADGIAVAIEFVPAQTSDP